MRVPARAPPARLSFCRPTHNDAAPPFHPPPHPPPDRTERAADRLVWRGGPKLFNDLAGGLSAGAGYGLMATAVTYGGALAASAGQAAWFRPGCPQINAFVLTGASIDRCRVGADGGAAAAGGPPLIDADRPAPRPVARSPARPRCASLTRPVHHHHD